MSAATLSVVASVFKSGSPQNHKTGTPEASVTRLTCFRDMVGQAVLALARPENLMYFTCVSTTEKMYDLITFQVKVVALW